MLHLHASPGSVYPSLKYCMMLTMKRGNTISDISSKSLGTVGTFSPVFNRCRLQNLPKAMHQHHTVPSVTTQQSILRVSLELLKNKYVLGPFNSREPTQSSCFLNVISNILNIIYVYFNNNLKGIKPLL